MLVKSPSAIPSSEITDRSTYLRRREFLQTAVGATLAAATAFASASAQGGARQKARRRQEGPVWHDRSVDALRGRDHLQQFL